MSQKIKSKAPAAPLKPKANSLVALLEKNRAQKLQEPKKPKK